MEDDAAGAARQLRELLPRLRSGELNRSSEARQEQVRLLNRLHDLQLLRRQELPGILGVSVRQAERLWRGDSSLLAKHVDRIESLLRDSRIRLVIPPCWEMLVCHAFSRMKRLSRQLAVRIVRDALPHVVSEVRAGEGCFGILPASIPSTAAGRGLEAHPEPFYSYRDYYLFGKVYWAERVLETLRSRLRSDDPVVREEAAAAVGGVEALAEGRASLQDLDPGARRHALNALLTNAQILVENDAELERVVRRRFGDYLSVLRLTTPAIGRGSDVLFRRFRYSVPNLAPECHLFCGSLRHYGFLLANGYMVDDPQCPHLPRLTGVPSLTGISHPKEDARCFLLVGPADGWDPTVVTLVYPSHLSPSLVRRAHREVRGVWEQAYRGLARLVRELEQDTDPKIRDAAVEEANLLYDVLEDCVGTQEWLPLQEDFVRLLPAIVWGMVPLTPDLAPETVR